MCAYRPINIHVCVKTSTCDSMFLYEARPEFLLGSPTLMHDPWLMLTPCPCFSVAHAHCERPGSRHLPHVSLMVPWT